MPNRGLLGRGHPPTIARAAVFSASGLTGAANASRYAGATTGGAPASGVFAAGDWIVDLTGTIYICTVAGAPGTWVQVAASTSGQYANPMTAKGDVVVGQGTGLDQALSSNGGTVTTNRSVAAGPPSNANDGNDATKSEPTSPVGGAIYTVDLGSAKSIGSFRLLGESAGSSYRATNYTVESSPDNSTWTVRHTMTAQSAVVDSGTVTLSSGAVTARYWRLNCSTGGIDGWNVFTLAFFSGSPVGTAARLAVGTDDYLLLADSAQLNGVKWGPRRLYQTLVDGATVAWDTRLGNAQVTLGGNRTLGLPTNLLAGQTYFLIVIQDGTGTRTLTWNAVFKWAGTTAPTLSTVAARKDVFVFITDGTNLYCISQQINVA